MSKAFRTVFGTMAIWAVCAVADTGEGAAGAVRFEAQDPVPMPELGAWTTAGGEGEANAYAGDYAGCGVKEIGFRFLAADTLPSSAIVRWKGGTRSYFKKLDLSGAAAGEWVDCVLSLEGLEAGGWTGVGTTEEEFSADLGDVKWVEVQVCRKGMGAQEYRLDGFYVGADGEAIDVNGGGTGGELHAVAIRFGEGGAEVEWAGLQAGTEYEVERADAVGEGREWNWVSAGVFSPTNGQAVWVDAETNAHLRVYRLKSEQD